MLMLFVTLQTWYSSRLGQARERGATMVEYGLLIAGIALVAVTGARLLGSSINTFFRSITFS